MNNNDFCLVHDVVKGFTTGMRVKFHTSSHAVGKIVGFTKMLDSENCIGVVWDHDPKQTYYYMPHQVKKI